MSEGLTASRDGQLCCAHTFPRLWNPASVKPRACLPRVLEMSLPLGAATSSSIGRAWERVGRTTPRPARGPSATGQPPISVPAASNPRALPWDGSEHPHGRGRENPSSSSRAVKNVYKRLW